MLKLNSKRINKALKLSEKPLRSSLEQPNTVAPLLTKQAKKSLGLFKG